MKTLVKHACMFLMLVIVAGRASAQPKPNIILVSADNLGYGEIGAYGGGITRGAPTPRIDALAHEGTRLTNFNVEPSCTPSRSALMTRRYPIRSGTYSVPADGRPYGLVRSSTNRNIWRMRVPRAERLSSEDRGLSAFRNNEFVRRDADYVTKEKIG